MRIIVRAALAALLALSTLLGLNAVASADTLPCDVGELCLWTEPSFGGTRTVLSLADTYVEECVPLAGEARSFVNRLNRPVTVYQGADCSTEGEFDTYPGGGTYAPSPPFVVRGVQIWMA